jgi:hypothetical protein
MVMLVKENKSRQRLLRGNEKDAKDSHDSKAQSEIAENVQTTYCFLIKSSPLFNEFGDLFSIMLIFP